MSKNRAQRRHPSTELAEDLSRYVPRKRLWSMDETAEQLGVHRTYLYDLIAAGDLVQVHIGKRAMITDESVTRFVAKLESDAAAG